MTLGPLARTRLNQTSFRSSVRPHSLTQSLQLLHGLLPDGLDVDAGEAPLGRDLNQVGPLEAVGHYIVVILSEVEHVLAVGEVAAGAREMEEGFVEVEAVLVAMETLSWLAVVLVLVHLTESVEVGPALFIGQDLWESGDRHHL